MEKIKGKDKKKGSSDGGLGWLKDRFSELKHGARGSLFYRLLVFSLGLVFSRCHIAFGARPLGIVLAALLPDNVWVAAGGAALGSLTLGADGIIFSVAIAITVFLRIIISGGDKERARLFGESIRARMAVSVVGGFVVGVYRALISGFGFSGVLFLGAMVIIPPLIVFIFSGIFSTGVGIEALISGRRASFKLSGKDEGEKLNTVFFGLSTLSFIFFISLSLGEYSLFGINLSYIFSGFITLVVAKRMGALCALAVGFIAPLGISGIYSVAFALCGLGAGLLFSFGLAYGLIVGGVLLAAWSAYAGGLSGFLTTLPEYLIAATLYAPISKSVESEPSPEREIEIKESARDMVGTVALKYQGRRSEGLDGMEASLSALARLIRSYSVEREPVTLEEYEKIVSAAAERTCLGCESLGLCRAQNISPCKKNAGSIAEALMRGERITGSDVNTDTEFCKHSEELSNEINRTAERAAARLKNTSESAGVADEYELMARLLSEIRFRDAEEKAPADELTAPLARVAEEFGFEGGIIRAFGKRRRHFILAGEDEGGKKISSEKLREGIEAAAGVRLGTPEYYKNGKMALMECSAKRAFRVECASGMLAGDKSEVSGDTAIMFESSDERFFAVISDGMGSGELARQTSGFAARFLEKALDCGASEETVLHLLNNSLIRRREECSATADIFELDLLSGEAIFIKCGAAPSFIKRDSSIFRIKSSTAPIGLMRSVDAEKIRVEVREGDIVVMLSDGVLDCSEDGTWLIELLSRKPKADLKEYAELILCEAKKHAKAKDDMSVVLAKVSRA